jgi:hypothetical protein
MREMMALVSPTQNGDEHHISIRLRKWQTLIIQADEN